MKKRDRQVKVFLHRSTGQVLLFPYVCYMGGESAPVGQAFALPNPDPLPLANHILQLLRNCKKVDVDELKENRMAQLRRFWKNADSGSEGASDTSRLDVSWHRLAQEFPEIEKGPGTFLRRFNVCTVLERDQCKYRTIIRTQPSKYRNCVTDGESRRIAVVAKPKQLADLVLEVLDYRPSVRVSAD